MCVTYVCNYDKQCCLQGDKVMNAQPTPTSRPLTLADVCEAIANGSLPAAQEDGYYTVSARALRRLRPEADLRAPRRRPVRQPDRIAS
jgi:hypothetical protein